MASWQRRFFRFGLSSLKATIDYTAPVHELRLKTELAARLAKFPRGVTVEPACIAGLPAEWLCPAGSAPAGVMLYLHGGGYVLGSCRSHRALVARLARAGRVRILSLEYRLAPEHPFPAAVEDAAAAYRWLLQKGGSPQQLLIAGDSAGGGLALATLVSMRDQGEPLPAAAVYLSPLTDLAGTGESMVSKAQVDPWLAPQVKALLQHYIGQNDPRSPLLSPLYADLRGLPPMLIQVGSDEILLSDSTRLAQRAQAAGVPVTLQEWPGMWHVFQAWSPYLPEANQAVQEIGRFIRRSLMVQKG
jgi:acetyl esterase/lipase